MDQSCDAWIAHCFDHPVREPAWHFDVDAPVGSVSAAVAVAHLTRLFLSPSAVLAPYSDEQINQGLWYIAHAGNSDFVFAIVDATIPVTERVACVMAMAGLYDDLFAPRCAPTLGHAPDGAAGELPLNSACYMWWDYCRCFPARRIPIGPLSTSRRWASCGTRCRWTPSPVRNQPCMDSGTGRSAIQQRFRLRSMHSLNEATSVPRFVSTH